MVCSVFSDVIDTEVVDHKGETDIFGGMLPNGRGLSNGGVSKLVKVGLEPIICNTSGLFQAWHIFVDIQVYPSVGCELEEVVLGDNFFRKYFWAYFRILLSPHRGLVIFLNPE